MFFDYVKYCDLCNRMGVGTTAPAEAIGLSRAAASGWAKGSQPKDRYIVALAKYFGVDVSELCENEQKKSTPSVESVLRKLCQLNDEYLSSADHYVSFLLDHQDRH